MADLEKEVALLRGEPGNEIYLEVTLLKRELAEHQKSMATIELVNQKLNEELCAAREECCSLQQEVQGKTSQVKQYAKEVGRLKQQVLQLKCFVSLKIQDYCRLRWLRTVSCLK